MAGILLCAVQIKKGASNEPELKANACRNDDIVTNSRDFGWRHGRNFRAIHPKLYRQSNLYGVIVMQKPSIVNTNRHLKKISSEMHKESSPFLPHFRLFSMRAGGVNAVTVLLYHPGLKLTR